MQHLQLNMKQHSRSGVTLTEVLTSILIMALGVSFVISLFPVAMLRSLKASQLTNAALTRLNAEAIIDLLPGIIHDPDGDGDLVEHFRYQNERNYIIDPWGYSIHWSDGSPAAGVAPSPRVDGYRDWFGNTGAEPSLVGNTNAASPNGYPSGLPTLPRFDGGLYNSLTASLGASPTITRMEKEAAALVASRDGWVEHVDVEVTGANLDAHSVNGGIYKVTLPMDVDLSTLPTDGASGAWDLVTDSRIVIYNEVGRVSSAFPITAVNTGTGEVTWSEDFVSDNEMIDTDEDRNSNGELEVRVLSDQFLDGTVFSASRVVLEVSKARHYSWMLTVRKGTDGQAGVDVVVVFNRGVDPENERVFEATFITQSNQVYVKNVPATATSSLIKPKLKRGGFVLDTQNARWYRIQGIDEPSLGATWDYGTYDYVLRIDRNAIEQAGDDKDNSGDTPAGPLPNGTLDAGEDGTDFGGAMFMPGVVEVYPLGTKTLPGSGL